MYDGGWLSRSTFDIANINLLPGESLTGLQEQSRLLRKMVTNDEDYDR